MKKLYIIFLIFGVVTLSSCEKFLTLDPIDSIGSESFYQNSDEVDAGIISIYSGLRGVYDFEYALTEMRTDNARTRNSEGEWAQFEFMNVDPTNATLSTYYSDSYNVIFQANLMTEHLDVVTDETLKNQFEGEIYFLRSMMYFNMVRLWGDVPLVDRVVGHDELEMSQRVAVSEVYTFIVNDLTSAIGKLPSRSEAEEGRASKEAAQALLAKVYLTLDNYSGALTLLEDVILSGNYSLEDNYGDIFFSGSRDEILFSVEYVEGSENYGNNFSYALSPQGRAGGLNWPTDDLLNAMDTAVDLRTDTTFYWNALAGSSGDWACGKYINPNNLEFAGNTWIVSRYADVYLMYCEAVLAGASSTSNGVALGYINDIRERAGLTDLTEITPENLLYERRCEFAFENQRLFDLIRFGVVEAVLGDFSTSDEAGFVFSSTDLLLPIPQRELNLYPEMGQNPGY